VAVVILYILSAIILMNMLVIMVAAYPYIAPLLQGVFVDPIYGTLSLAIIIVALGMFNMVRRRA